MAPKIQWPLVLFSMLAGCGGCCFAFAGVAGALGESTTVTLWATGISLVLVVVGAVCSMMHLATPRHAFAAVTHLLSFSGISVELIMLGVVSALMAAYGAACLWFDNRAGAPRARHCRSSGRRRAGFCNGPWLPHLIKAHLEYEEAAFGLYGARRLWPAGFSTRWCRWRRGASGLWSCP